jgi:hypothetical protein
VLRLRRTVLSIAVAAPLAVGALVALPAPPAAAAGSVVINEIESDDPGAGPDWIELANPGDSSLDIGGYVLKDNNDGNSFTFPAPTILPAGGYVAADALGFGLGSADSARLFTSGAALIDSYSWTSHAATTYARCPDGTGPIGSSAAASKGAANICPAPGTPWPGGAAVTAADTPGALGGNVSGLAYQASGTSTPGTLWAVKNDPGTLYRLTRSGSTWSAAASWVLHYPNGLGNPDSEGVTLTDAGPDAGVYVATERDGGGGSRPAVERFLPGPGGTLDATNDWDLSADLPGLGANAGLEAIAWVPDSYLTARGFKTGGGTTYDPAAYPNHGSGLFFVGVEQTGEVIAYALDHSGSGFTRVATIISGFPAVMDLTYDPDTQKLWVVCDNSCNGQIALFDVSTAVGPNQGTFVRGTTYDRPSGMPNLNNEGFTISARGECAGGVKPALWSDDSNTGGTVLRAGTLSCTSISGTASAARPRSASGWYAGPVTVSFSCTAGPLPLSGSCPAAVTLLTSGADQAVTRSVTDTAGLTVQATVNDIDIDLDKPKVKIKGVKKGKAYTHLMKVKCKASDALSGLDGKCKVKQKKKGSKVKVTVTATDKAGNVTTAKLTYKLKPKKK